MRRATKKDYTAVTQKTTPFRQAVERNISNAHLKDHGGSASISMYWNLNEPAVRDHIFRLEINDQVAYIDLEELMSYTRLF